MIDNKIQQILAKEQARQRNTIELIASENFASNEIMQLTGSVFTNKYAEGYPGKRYYNGCEHVDEVEELAINKLTTLFGCNFANVQPHCGANANTAVFQAFLNPGDTILGMDLASGGHLSHGSTPNISGKVYNAFSYGVDANGWINYDEVERLAQQHSPKMIICGASAYSRQIDFARFRAIADTVGAVLLADIAHYSGLIAGGAYQTPVGFADVITSTTHKTLRGPRGGVIMWNNQDYTRKINSAIFPGTQGGPLMNTIAAKAQCFIEADTVSFKNYAAQVVSNAKIMCEVFNNYGVKTLTNGTDSHIILIDLSNSKYSGKEAANILEEYSITVNKNSIPNDQRSFIETSGIRLGTAAETTRGHDTQWFMELAETIANILNT